MKKFVNSAFYGTNLTFLVFCLLFLSLSLKSQVSQQWVQRYNGSGNGNDVANALTTDAAGNVYITGRSYTNGATTDDIVTIKYNSTGVQQWQQTYNGAGSYLDNASAIAVDAAGNVYVSGFGAGSFTNDDYFTLKYNSAGVMQWAKVFYGGVQGGGAYALAIDGAGNVYVTGTSSNGGSNGDIVTIKYNSFGTQLWAKSYNGSGNAIDAGTCMVVDAAGNCFVGGKTTSSSNGLDYITIKYDSSGNQQWLQMYNGPGNGEDYINSMVIDATGNVYVTGKSFGGASTNADYATLKYNSSGTQQWINRYNGPNNQIDVATSLAIDGTGNVFVTGYINSGSSGDDWGTIKLNSSGTLQWAKIYNVNFDEATDLCIDTNGDVYVTGIGGGGYKTIKYNSAGTQLWLQVYTGPAAAADQSNAITLDNAGNVYITGYSTGTTSVYDYATVKYSQTSPPVPTLVSPANNSVNQPLTLNLVWNKSIFANTYRVQVALDSLFSTIIVNDSTLTDSVKNVTGLNNITNYWWRVNSKNIFGTSAYSVVNKFTTIVPVPLAPNLYTPSNNAVNQPITLNLVWSKPQYSASYRVQLSTDSLFNTLIVNDSTLTDSIRSVSGLTNSTNYWWRVRAKNVAGTGNYSIISKFTTIIANPTVPLQFSPQNGSLNIPLNTDLVWYKLLNAQTYHIQFSTDSLFNSTIINDSTLTDSIKSVTGLNRATNYFWRVRAKNIGGYSAFSSTWKFTTIPFAPSTPNLLTPSNGSTGLSLTPLLDWDSVTTASSYIVQVATDTGFTNKVVDSSVTYSLCNIPAGRLSNNNLYYWRVESVNPGGSSNWSAVWNFRVAPIGISNNNNEIPKEFKLYDNYPNPFNPATKINVDIPKESFAKLIVFDILGREVSRLIDWKLKAGKYTVDWNAGNLPSGIYFYRLIAENYTSTKKMILIK